MCKIDLLPVAFGHPKNISHGLRFLTGTYLDQMDDKQHMLQMMHDYESKPLFLKQGAILLEAAT